MKKHRKAEFGKKMMSGILAATMAMEFVPGMATAVSAAMDEKLAVYEPDGIAGSVMATSQDADGKTYVGTLFQSDLRTGERDVAALQLYPCNNLKLREISDATLTFLKPDGTPYNGDVILRGGAYKNGIYCPDAKIRVGADGAEQNGREDIRATVKDFCERNDLPFLGIHAFRHTYASILVNQGVDIVAVSFSLGHSQVSTTSNIYCHMLDNARAKAANAISSVLDTDSGFDAQISK